MAYQWQHEGKLYNVEQSFAHGYVSVWRDKREVFFAQDEAAYELLDMHPQEVLKSLGSAGTFDEEG